MIELLNLKPDMTPEEAFTRIHEVGAGTYSSPKACAQVAAKRMNKLAQDTASGSNRRGANLAR
jgi:hypothetical protein